MATPPPHHSAAPGAQEDVFLFERSQVAAWSSQPPETKRYLPPQTDPNYSDLPGRILANVASVVAGALDGTVLSPSIPPSLLKSLPKTQHPHTIQLSPCRAYLAILFEDRLQIRFCDSESHSAVGMVLERDDFPGWRKLCWSPDSKFLAIASSIGSIRVVHIESAGYCTIGPHVTKPHSVPSSVWIDWEKYGVDPRKERLGIVDPFCFLAFTDLGPIQADGHSYTHRLVSINYSGMLVSYILNEAEFSRTSADRKFPLHLPKCTREHPDLLVFDHAASFQSTHSYISAVLLDPQSKALILSGKPAPQKASSSASASPEDFITRWTIHDSAPHYRAAEPSALSPAEECAISADADGFWYSVSKMFSIWSSSPASTAGLVHHLALSPDSSLLASLDTNGLLKIWRLHPMELLHVWSSKALSEAYLPSSSSALSKSLPPTETPAVVSTVEWWSPTSVALTFSNGSLVLAALPSLSNLLGDKPELFNDPRPVIAPIPNEKLYALECDRQVLRYQFVRYGPSWRMVRVNAEADAAHPQSTAAAAQLTLAEWIAALVSERLAFITQVFVGDVAGPAAPETRPPVSVVESSYTLWTVVKMTVHDAISRKLELREYSQALALAQRFGINPDRIYQHQWTHEPLTEESVPACLGQIKDRSWVLDVCLSRIPDHPRLARQLLLYALDQTGIVKEHDVDTEIEDVLSGAPTDFESSAAHLQRTRFLQQYALQDAILPSTDILILYRRKALHYLAMLETHQAIYASADYSQFPHKYSTFPLHLAHFRDSGLLKLAEEFAVCGNVTALEVMLTRHGAELLNYRISLLNLIPESVDPETYSRLLPRIDARTDTEELWVTIPWRVKDWSEASQIVDEFLIMTDSDDPATARPRIAATETTLLARREYPLAHSELTDWYIRRAYEIEERSGLVNFARAFVHLGIASRVDGLQDLFEDLCTLYSLVYEFYDPSSELCADMSLPKLQALSSSQVFELFVARITRDTLLDDFQRSILPYLSSVARRWDRSIQPDGRTSYQDMELIQNPLTLLREYLLNLSHTHLDWCCLIFEQSASALVSGTGGEPIIRSLESIYDFAFEVLYDCPDPDAVELKERFLACLTSLAGIEQQADSGDSWEDQLRVEELDMVEPLSNLYRTRIQELEKHIKASKVLSKYRLGKPLAWFVSSSKKQDEQRLVLAKLARTLKGPGVSREAQWNTLLADALDLRNWGALAGLPVVELYKEITGVALVSQNFVFARSVLLPSDRMPPIPPDEIEDLVLDASREYFDNADSANMYEGSLKLAYDCLRILPESPRLKTELEYIEACHALATVYRVSFNEAEILPIQIRIQGDPFALIHTALSNGVVRNAYKSPAALLEIARKLGHADATSRVRVRALCALAALDVEDYQGAFDHLKSIIHGDAAVKGSAKVEVAQVCKRLSETRRFDDLNVKMTVIGYGLTVCPPGEIAALLQIWRSLEAERLSHSALLLEDDTDSRTGESLMPRLSQLLKNGEFDQSLAMAEIQSALDQYDLTGNELGIDQAFVQVHDLYSSSAVVASPAETYRFVPDESAVDSDTFAKRPLRLLQILDRLRQSRFGVWSESSVADRDLVNIAVQSYESDAMLALAYLLHLSQDSSASPFFDSLHPSQIHEQLACYYFSLRALYHIANQQSAHLLLKLVSYPPREIMALVRAIPLDLLQGQPGADRFAEAVQLSSRYSGLLKNKRQQQLLESIFLDGTISKDRFESDAFYRLESLKQLVRTTNFSTVETVISVAEHYQINREEIVLAHTFWILSEPSLDVTVVQHHLAVYQEIIDTYPAATLKILQSVHPLLVHSELSTLSTFYQLHLECQERVGLEDTLLGEQLRLRIGLLDKILGQSSLRGLRLRSFLAANIEGKQAYTVLWADLPQSREALEGFLDILPSCLALRFIESFQDESGISDPIRLSEGDLFGVASTVSITYIDNLLKLMDWDYSDLDRLVEVMDETRSLLPRLLAIDVTRIAASFCTGEKAIVVPIQVRQDFAKSCISALRARGSEGDSEALLEIEHISTHLDTVIQLYHIVDPTRDESIPIERIQQFDMLFGAEVPEVVALCMKMAIAGTSARIMTEIAGLMAQTCVNVADAAQLSVDRVYRESLLAVVGNPSLLAYRNIFRKGVDSPLAAIDRIVAAVSEFEVQGLADESNLWGDSEESAASLSSPGQQSAKVLEDAVRVTLSEVIQNTGSFSSELRVGISKIIEKVGRSGSPCDADLLATRFLCRCC
ncbi:secretory pathway protein Sec39-domain-containing protein [Polychytrium aggregatum]|uniref:secretory pathway protein Sec39-domain-containing protein n=1 Tax=Polychytrium aggregatum TaxID=110093 RepID=UPI0022FE1C3E|nr:secretory pathway protein Sec39-domain-containing protein [Polychytrium aggregatum]KAI9206904.1 secretory pathway protein Sec39-domain-containing protein [Polychytrium aggregatum]